MKKKFASKYISVASMVICTGFACVGLAQGFLSANRAINDAGYENPVIDGMANAAAFVGLPIYKWAAKTNVATVHTLPSALKRAVISVSSPS